MEAIEENTVGSNSTIYRGVAAPCFKTLRYRELAVPVAWTSYGDASQLTDDETLYEGQIFDQKEVFVHAIKTFSRRSHQ